MSEYINGNLYNRGFMSVPSLGTFTSYKPISSLPTTNGFFNYGPNSIAGTIGKVENVVPNTTTNSAMNTFTNGLGALAQLGQAGAGLMNAYTGYKNYKLAKEAFGFEKALSLRNLANQAKLINNAYDASANIAAGLNAIPTASDAYNKGLRDQALASAEKQKVSGTL